MSTIFSRSFGSVTVSVRSEVDEYPDVSYLGKYSDFVSSPDSYLYHIPSGLMWDGSRWRDKRGRIASEPEYGYRSGHYEFIDVGTCQFTRSTARSLTYAFQNAERLNSLGSLWEAVCLVAEVEIDGVTVATYCIGGYESDSDDYLESEARNVAYEALADARRWLDRRCA